MISPDRGSLLRLIRGRKRVHVLSGSEIPPSLPSQSFHVEDRLEITMNAFGRDGRDQRAWRRTVPPEVLAQLEEIFPIEKKYMDLDRVPDGDLFR